MTIFTLRSLKKDFGIKELLTDASFSLDELAVGAKATRISMSLSA
jgi:hypothetical protein